MLIVVGADIEAGIVKLLQTSSVISLITYYRITTYQLWAKELENTLHVLVQCKYTL